jgi:hypothetical protein
MAIIPLGSTNLINGNPTASPNDMWFQEGIVTVPEPATIALVGLSSLLAFVFKRRPKLPVLLFASVLLTVQTLSADAAPDSVVQTTADAAGLTLVSANTVP